MVKDILESNGLYSNDINKFVYQPLASVVKNVNKYAPIVANAITSTSAYIKKLIVIGGNKLNNNELRLLQQVLRLLNES